MTRRIGNSNDNAPPDRTAAALDALAAALARQLARAHHAADSKTEARAGSKSPK